MPSSIHIKAFPMQLVFFSFQHDFSNEEVSYFTTYNIFGQLVVGIVIQYIWLPFQKNCLGSTG